MNCRQARSYFGPYWDDELTQAEREWLESHIAGCSACRGEYEALVRTLELAAQLPRAEVSPGFAERVLTHARRRAPAPDRIPSPRRRWVPVTAAAALAAVLGATVLQWVDMPPHPAAPVPAPPAEVALIEPVRVEPERKAQAAAEDVREPILVPDGGLMAGATDEIPDSLFDHGEDVEFILDPVTLRKGRAHMTRLLPEAARGEPAVITF